MAASINIFCLILTSLSSLLIYEQRLDPRKKLRAALSTLASIVVVSLPIFGPCMVNLIIRPLKKGISRPTICITGLPSINSVFIWTVLLILGFLDPMVTLNLRGFPAFSLQILNSSSMSSILSTISPGFFTSNVLPVSLFSMLAVPFVVGWPKFR